MVLVTKELSRGSNTICYFVSVWRTCVPNTLMLLVTVILIQGTLHQWLVLRRRQHVGSLSFGLFYGILAKDISTLLFGLTMPFAQAWPLLVLNGASVITRGAVLLQMKHLQKKHLQK